MHIHIHVHTYVQHTYIHTYIHTHIHTYIHACIHTYIHNVQESNLPDEILEAIKVKGYKTPSAIQMQCIPLGLMNRDVVGIAQTGSGKTAAFVLPLLVYISKLGRITELNAAEGPMSVCCRQDCLYGMPLYYLARS